MGVPRRKRPSRERDSFGIRPLKEGLLSPRNINIMACEHEPEIRGASYKTVVGWLAAAEKRVLELENAIRKHAAQYQTGDVNDLCFENDFELYLVLPENHDKKLEDFIAPCLISKEEWLENCESYYCSRRKR